MATKKKTETQAPAPQAVTEQAQDTEMKGGVHAADVTEQEDEGRTQDAEQTAAAVQSPEAPADLCWKVFPCWRTGTVCLRGSRRPFCVSWTGRTTGW